MNDTTTGGWFLFGSSVSKREDDTWTPLEAQSALYALPLVTRRALAQLVSVYLTLDDVPPLSYPPELDSIVKPLVDLGLVLPSLEMLQGALHDYDDDWGTIPDGLRSGISVDSSLIGFVCAVIAGIPWNGQSTESLARRRDSQLRVFELRPDERGTLVPLAVMSSDTLALLREHIRACDDNSYQQVCQIVSWDPESAAGDELRERLARIKWLLKTRGEARAIMDQYVDGTRDSTSAIEALKALRRAIEPRDTIDEEGGMFYDE